MPELPEVETVRRGLQAVLVGRSIISADVRGERVVRRQPEGGGVFGGRLPGRRVESVKRRGKYLWWVLDGSAEALVAHLGMSGQFRSSAGGSQAPAVGPHVRASFTLDDGQVLSFVDQRTFGWLLLDDLAGGAPRCASHIALDPFDPRYDLEQTAQRLRSRRTGVKRALLDQGVVSGIGNIYADETLWRCRIHPSKATDSLTGPQARAILRSAAEVMGAALRAGGTSFDPLYVNVNGESGWFARELAAYGREGEPCLRCGRPMVREAFTNRSSYRCPGCQRLPVRRR